MSFTSIPVIANKIANKINRNVFFLLLKCFFFYEKLLSKENKTILSSNHTILMKLYVGNVYNRP